jgi:hypothetical protein
MTRLFAFVVEHWTGKGPGTAGLRAYLPIVKLAESWFKTASSRGRSVRAPPLFWREHAGLDYITFDAALHWRFRGRGVCFRPVGLWTLSVQGLPAPGGRTWHTTHIRRRGQPRPKFANWDPKRDVRSQKSRQSRSCEGCQAGRMADHHLGRVDGLTWASRRRQVASAICLRRSGSRATFLTRIPYDD